MLKKICDLLTATSTIYFGRKWVKEFFLLFDVLQLYVNYERFFYHKNKKKLIMALIQSGSVQSIISIHAKNGLTKLINDYQCYDII